MTGLVRGFDMDKDEVLGGQSVERGLGLALVVGVKIAGGTGHIDDGKSGIDTESL